MASTEIEPTRPKKVRQNFVSALFSAFLEWFLIFFLFIDAMISYVITKFARGCKLQTPCLLCSRLDHVLGKEKIGFYWDLMCRHHKSEVSSLVLCHAHNKLVDVHKMCENCLFSFATINKSNAETYRLLVGKLGEDLNSDVDQDPCLVDDDLQVGLLSSRNCACCNQPWFPRAHTHAKELIQTRFDALESAVDHDHEVSNSGRDRSVLLTATQSRKGATVDPLSHIGYTELKLNSDTESEALPSDDEEGASARAALRERDYHKNEFSVQRIEPQIVTLDADSASEKLLVPDLVPEPLLSKSQGDIIEHSDCKPQKSTAEIGHGLEELDWHEVIVTPAETTIHSVSPSDAIEAPVEVSETSLNATRTVEVVETSVAESDIEEVLEKGSPLNARAETGLETSAVASDSGQQITTSLDLGDAYKLAVDNRGKQLSGSLADQWLGKDSSRVTEDLKTLLSLLSSKGGFDLPISPKLSVNSDDQKTLEPSSSIGMQTFQKKFSLERNESGLSLDGSIVSEIEGETVVDRLKRQVEHDKRLMTALYKELEEERNASAVATNQAMAMITRLQEEKAALHMEALQYLRMMEEQAEYDDDELQKSNDLLAEKEKDVQDLEAELEYYKKKFPNERFLEDDMRITDIGVDNTEYNCVTDKNVDKGDSNSPILEFEDDKVYILQCLKKLETTIDLLSDEPETIRNLSKEEVRNHKARDNDEEEENVSSSGQDFHDETHLSNPSSAELSQETDMGSIRTTVSRLSKRLEALEEDRRFLEHSMNSLRNGNAGVEFVQQIASHLQELRKIATQKDLLVA